MDPKTENRLRMLIGKEDPLKRNGKALLEEHLTVLARYSSLDVRYAKLTNDLSAAIEAEDTDEIEKIKASMALIKEELDRLSKREKSLTDEVEMINAARKDDLEGKSAAWKTAGAWFIGTTTLVLRGLGLLASHRAFENGDLVDKQTRSLAERLSGLLNFFNFVKS